MKMFKNIVFYILSLTWGIIMTLIGFIVAGVLIIKGYKPKVFNKRLYIEIGENWGGAELGCIFLCCNSSSLSLKQHEAGHGLQNAIFGPITPFLVSIPSAIRYWLREMETMKKKWIYSSSIVAIALILGLGCLIPGIIFNVLGLIIIGSIVTAYAIAISIWLLAIETPKYKNGNSPAYDSIWFEGQATKWGAKEFPEDIT